MKVDSLCTACESVLDLSSASLSASYYYDSLPYCVIDAVFSIGVKYTSTQNVVKNYCTYYGLREYNTKQDNDGDTHTISQLVEHIESMGIEKSADVVFRNHQRTSSRNGILKADAVLRFARILQKGSLTKQRKKYCESQGNGAGYPFDISICSREMIHKLNPIAMCYGF